MSAEAFTRLMDSARVRLPSAMEGVLKLELFQVLKEFTQRSNVWQETIGFEVSPEEVDYELTPENDAAINRLIYVTPADTPTVAIPATMSTPGVVRLLRMPSEAQLLSAVVALTVIDPTDEAGFPQFPEGLLEKYFSGILDGVLSRMMSQPAKPYSSEKSAAVHGFRFRQATNLAKREAQAGNTFRVQTWRFPQTMR